MIDCAALVVAAGRGSRMSGAVPKQYRLLAGEPVLRHSLRRFMRHPRVGAVVTVIHPDDREFYDRAADGLGILPPVPGGRERQDSVRLGLEALIPQAPRLVLIHDAARPFVDDGAIDRVIDALGEFPGAIAALPVVDTIKRGIGTRTDRDRIGGTLDRTGLWRAQTPQGFHFDAILAAHRAAGCRAASDPAAGAMTDDAAVAEAAGLEVALVRGSDENFKVTTEEDLQRAEIVAGKGGWETRVGSGFDVHPFAPGDHVWLCGVKIAHTHRLEGHSDADAGLHAITDAILGALGEGDIGAHFPPGDPQWRGAPSDKFLRFAGELVAKRGGRIAHVDVTIICEAPRVGPHRQDMRAKIAEILAIAPDRVGVKATTTEGLGFTGRKEGLAAQAVASVQFPSRFSS